MGVKETMRGLGCMAKGVGCILAVAVGGFMLLRGIGLGILYVGNVVNEHWDVISVVICVTIYAVIIAVVIAIILVIANAIGKESD